MPVEAGTSFGVQLGTERRTQRPWRRMGKKRVVTKGSKQEAIRLRQRHVFPEVRPLVPLNDSSRAEAEICFGYADGPRRTGEREGHQCQARHPARRYSRKPRQDVARGYTYS